MLGPRPVLTFLVDLFANLPKAFKATILWGSDLVGKTILIKERQHFHNWASKELSI